MRERLIVGLDVADRQEAEKIVSLLGDSVNFYKIGYQLAFTGGLQFISDLRSLGKYVFLDMKLLDIDHTVERAVENILHLDVAMLTIHAYPHAMRAAVKVAAGSNLVLLAVTVLTSIAHEDLAEAGYQTTPFELVKMRAKQAMDIGMGGIVASAQEAPMLRQIVTTDKAIVTPGIRLDPLVPVPDLQAGDDQKRVMTPYEAIRAGASHLVVARPIVKASDPLAAAKAILHDMNAAL